MSTAMERQSGRELTGTNPERTRSLPCFQPRVDIYEVSGELVLVADMPGVANESIDIVFENGVLAISGKVEKRQPEGTQYLLSEYGLGDYHRAFEVSEAIDATKISAEYSDGELVVHLPKAESARPRRIEVKSR